MNHEFISIIRAEWTELHQIRQDNIHVQRSSVLPKLT